MGRKGLRRYFTNDSPPDFRIAEDIEDRDRCVTSAVISGNYTQVESVVDAQESADTAKAQVVGPGV